jgi:site-specific DNA recombinase
MVVPRFQLPDGEYWMYLRKSRADLEAEAKGEGETLARHRKILFRLSNELKINITKVFPEVESGESILHRPEMTMMLKEMEITPPKGILVMDIDRLGRGDKIDQGIIESTFKKSKTLIITPSNVYDMNDESGEFNVEVKTFLSRMEFKQINKRLQGGRIDSVEEGWYIGTRPPYGYTINKIGKKQRTLDPHPEQAQVVKMIFEWYTHEDPEQRIGAEKIAQKLNGMGYTTYTGIRWKNSSVLNIIKNAVYAGRIQWKKKEQKKSKDIGKKRDTRTRPKEEWIDVEGKHEALISIETYKKAQEILKKKYHVPYQLQNGITNPLAGLIKCDMCGTSMVKRPYTKQQPHFMCYNQLCKNKSSRFSYVEEKLLIGLKEWLDKYKAEWNKRKRPDINISDDLQLKKSAIRSLERELEELKKQKGKLHDFLERGIYDEETYLERSKHLAEQIETVQDSITRTTKGIEVELQREKAQKNVIPSVENVLDLYNKTEDPGKRNTLLKSVLDKAIYRKEKYQKDDNFTLTLYLKLDH